MYNINMTSSKYFTLFLSLTLFLCINEINSAMLRIPDTEDKDHPKMCHYKDENGKTILLLKPEETKKHPSECSDVYCGENFEIIIFTCGKQDGGENCTFVKGNINDPLPECCGKYICNEN